MIRSYRPDIDGLRALAVLPVVFFHAGLPGFSGGYVGVDVFFVVSGFLITRIVAGELEAGAFSLLGFFRRRVRRIAPALLAMIGAVLLAAHPLLLPEDYRALALSALGALGSFSNFLFFEQAGYFAAEAATQPLLHTWSLGVEEQFYLVLPLLLMALAARGGRWLMPVLVGLFAASLVSALVLTEGWSDFVFYLLPSRAWELLAGSLLALRALPPVSSLRWREGLGVLGLASIAAAVFLFDAETPFPGPGALLPVAGTVLVLHCAPGTRVARALGAWPLVAVGLRSYSLYLWHWPIMVLMAYGGGEPLSVPMGVLAIFLSLLAAQLSFALVEQPFRHGPGPVWRPFFAGTACLAALAGAIALSGGVPGRFGTELAALSEERNASPLRLQCHERDEQTIAPTEACRLGDPDATPTIAVWGDSHGVELAYALGEAGRRSGFGLVQLTASGCAPTLAPAATARACTEQNRDVLAFLLARPAIRTVVLATYFEFDPYSADPGFGEGYLNTVRALERAGREVVVLGPVPEQPFDVLRRLALSAALDRPAPEGLREDAFLQRSDAMLDLMEAARRAGAAVLLPHETLCANGVCALSRNGRPLYFDEHHLSLDGARLMAELMLPLIARPSGG